MVTCSRNLVLPPLGMVLQKAMKQGRNVNGIPSHDGAEFGLGAARKLAS